MKSGDVCLAQYPFTDGSSTKLRPVLVVSADQFNHGGDLVVLPITSSLNPKDQHTFPIDKSAVYFGSTGLRYASAVKWTKPLAISKSVLVRRLGSVPSDVLQQIRDNLQSVFA
jgi:mRNA interferase MazF